MKISGLQKLTLLDYPGHLAAILFLEGCNFRCPFCQNSSLVLPVSAAKSMDPAAAPAAANPDIPLDTVLKFLKKRAGILEGVCISGGEPTLSHDLPDLIHQIRELGYAVKLDTNGTNPRMLENLLNENLLDYVAIDIKAGRNNYLRTAGLSEKHTVKEHLLDTVSQSVDLLMNSSIDYEFRTTVVKGLHSEEDFKDIADWLKGCRHYYLQSFRDCESVLQPHHNFSAFSDAEMLHFLQIMKKSIPNAALRGMDSDLTQ